MSILDDKAKQILSNYDPENPSLDPIMIITIAEILLEAIIALYKCYNTKEEALKEFKSPGIVTKIMLARLINKHSRGSNMNQRKLRNEIMKTDFTLEEIQTIIKEHENEIS